MTKNFRWWMMITASCIWFALWLWFNKIELIIIANTWLAAAFMLNDY